MNENFKRQRPLFWRNNYFDRKIALRDGKWKILGSSDRKSFELYDLQSDPRETTDLSAVEPDIFGSMRQLLVEYDKEVLAEGPKWWNRNKKISKDIPVD